MTKRIYDLRRRNKPPALEISPSPSPAIQGETSFAMNDIPDESLSPELYLNWDVPAGANLPLLVYIHGWDGGGNINLDANAIAYLKGLGIGIIGVGMRGRNTGVDFANDSDDVLEFRDAGALENYDVLATLRYFFDNIVQTGHIDKNKISFWVISGGGGAGAGCACKMPGLIAVDVLWYAISKYGTYTEDTLPALTSWYTDNAGFQGAIQQAISGAPLSSAQADEGYISRDHIQGIGNSADTIFHVYHDTGDATVFDDLSDALTAKLSANGQTYTYYHSSDGSYGHGEADLLDGKFSLDPQHGLEWVNDVLSTSRQAIGNSGTLRVCGFLIPVNEDLTAIFEIWIKTYRTNNTASPRAGSYRNQGKESAASVTYNLTAETFQITLIKGNESSGEQWKFIEINKGSKTITALLATDDVVTMVPKTLSKTPFGLTSYNWELFYDLSDSSDGYLLDDQNKVSNIYDLTGNNHIAFQQTRATRASIVSGSLDNGIMYLSGSGTFGTNALLVQFSGDFTVIFGIDPDAADIASIGTQGILGRGIGGDTRVQLTVFSGAAQIIIRDNNDVTLAGSGMGNTDVGKQVWTIRRDSNDDYYLTIKNASGTYDYGNIGNSTGVFEIRAIGAAISTSKEFEGKIFSLAAIGQDIGATDAATGRDTEYSRIAAL